MATSASPNFLGSDAGCFGGMGVPNVFYSYWFVKSDHLGKVSVGLQSSAGDNAAILVDGSGSLVPANWVHVRQRRLLHSRQGMVRSRTSTWGGLSFCNIGFGNRLATA